MNPEEEVSVEEEAENPQPIPPIYTCRTVLDVQMQKEATEAAKPKYSKYLNYICFALCAVMFGMLLWAYIGGRQPLNLILALLVLAVGFYLVYSQFAMPKKMLVQWEENLRRNFGTNALHMTTEFYKYSIAQTVDETDDILVDNYSALRAVVETEHLFLLKKGSSSWYFLSKDGLQNCSADEFRSFISEQIGGK